MDPKTLRIDAGNPSERERLIERGHLALIAIATQAQAARVEVQKAELEVALSEARGGNGNLLRNWLANYYESCESRSAPVTALEPLQGPDTLSFPVEEPGAPICSAQAILSLESSPMGASPESSLSWNRLLPAARERLKARSSSLPGSEQGDRDNSLALQDASNAVAERYSENDVASEVTNDFNSEQPKEELPKEELLEEEVRENQLPEELLFDDELAEELKTNEPLVYEDLPELKVLANAQRDLSQPFFRSGKRGLVVSSIVHIALIGTLMAIKMHIPEQVASLGFDSSREVSSESIEVLQTMEVIAPSDVSPEMPSEAAESSVSLPSAVGLASTAASSVSQTSASSVSGVQASASRAVAATSGRPNPAHANASFFGAGASGNCFCYVIDGSESMRGGPWEAAKAELLRSLASMKESHRFYIIFFNEKLNAITMPGEREPATSPLYATAENLKHAGNWIESLRIERGAPPTAALLHAIELDPDAIYLLADGATKIDVPEFLRAKNRTSDFISGEQVRVPIHAIAFYSPEAGQKLMHQIALENKGQFIYVPDPRKK